MKENKYFSALNFWLPIGYVLALGFFFSDQSKDTKFLHRDQTDEWKGRLNLSFSFHLFLFLLLFFVVLFFFVHKIISKSLDLDHHDESISQLRRINDNNFEKLE